jgi:hypothetical protein
MVFCFFQNFFSGQHELEYLFFLSRKAWIIFLQNLTLGYMTKTLNQIFFSSTKIRIFFQQHWESEYYFRKKKHNPPLEVQRSVPNKHHIVIWYELQTCIWQSQKNYMAPFKSDETVLIESWFRRRWDNWLKCHIFLWLY